MKFHRSVLLLVIVTCWTLGNHQLSFAQNSSTLSSKPADALSPLEQPRPTPRTRPEMKRLLEDMKLRAERIPLPAMSDAEKDSSDSRSQGYEARLSKMFLPTTAGIRGYLNFSGSPRRSPSAAQPSNRPTVDEDTALSLDYGFKTRLFWIASRVNNCQYCLGHQESKLLGVGMLEDEIAALDGNWSLFPESEQAAFALARRLTLEPHLLTNEDINQCKKHFTELQVLEIVLSVAGNNAINRWKEGVGVPQSSGGGNFGGPNRDAGDPKSHSYLTDTSDLYRNAFSTIVFTNESSPSDVSARTIMDRKTNAGDVRQRLVEASNRTPRLAPVSSERAKEVLGDIVPTGSVPHWMRLLANFPIAGRRQIASFVTTENELQLSPLVRAQMSWVIALQNGAWYSLSEAHKRLVKLGQNEEQITALSQLDDRPGNERLSLQAHALLVVAKNLAASPVVLTDTQFAHAVKVTGTQDVVQTVHYTAMRSMFDRFTEAAALATDP